MQPYPALMAAIRADPDADAPRLVFADWLEDRDPAWAELVRLQVRAARLPADDREALGLIDSAETLIARHGHRWREGLPGLSGVRWGAFERGVVSAVTASSVGAVFQHADAIACHHAVQRVDLALQFPAPGHWTPRPLPWVRTVRMDEPPHPNRTTPHDLEGLRMLVERAEHVALDSWSLRMDDVLPRDASPLVHLETTGPFGPLERDLIRIASSGLALQSLRLPRRSVQRYPFRAGLARHLGAPCLRGLRRLDLDGHRLVERDLAWIFEHFRSLDALSVHGASIETVPLADGASLRELSMAYCPPTLSLDFLDHPRAHALRRLELPAGRGRSPSPLHRIARSPCWSTLRRLDLRNQSLMGLGDRPLPPPAHLHTLRMPDAMHRDEDVKSLIEEPWVRGLRHLDLSGVMATGAFSGGPELAIEELVLLRTSLTPDDVTGLIPSLPRIRSLNLAQNAATAAIALLLLTEAPQMTTLDLRWTGFGSAWSSAVGEAWPRLHTLKLGHTQLGDAGLAALLEGPLGESLTTIHVVGCQLTDASIDTLLRWSRVGRLRRLTLGSNNLSAERLQSLREAAPYAEIVHFDDDDDDIPF